MADFWDVILCQTIDTNDSEEYFVSYIYSEDGGTCLSKQEASRCVE
jgi:hypothetical protein